MLDAVLIANRGEIARRIIRTVKEQGLRAVAVYSDADAELPFVAEADQAVRIGPAQPAESYRNIDAILNAARATKTTAIHPGYGFLAEDAAFAQAVMDAGLRWVGPNPSVITAMGDKIAARNTMRDAGVPVAAGTADPVTAETATAAAEAIGFPLMVKAAAGGGGMGMAVADSPDALAGVVEKVQGFAGRAFSSDKILLERYFPTVRHIEVQIMGLPNGEVIALGERDCSVQRRNQKLVEETPSPALDADQRAALLAAAVAAGKAVNYTNAGTVEFLYDPASQKFMFLEMNTRIQVEHPVTEATYGVDIVALQLAIADGQNPALTVAPQGHAIEFRINAEDPKRFLPGPGTITAWVEPQGDGIRVDSGYRDGNTVTPFYDSLLAKLIVHAADRDAALTLAGKALADFQISGPKNNLEFFHELLGNAAFLSGNYDTGIVASMRA